VQAAHYATLSTGIRASGVMQTVFIWFRMGSSEQKEESSSAVQSENSLISWISAIEASPRDMELVIWLSRWFLN
jgi:hypothetical protein